MTERQNIIEIINYYIKKNIFLFDDDEIKLINVASNLYLTEINKEEDNCFINEPEELISYLKGLRNYKMFFEQLKKLCNNFYHYINCNGIVEKVFLTKEINKIISNSFKNLKKIYDCCGLKFDHLPLKMDNINYTCNYRYNDDLKMDSLDLLRLVELLIDKLEEFINSNNIYETYYDLPLKLNKPIKNINNLKSLIGDVKYCLNKEYKIDFFSDGKEEIVEMVRVIYLSINFLSHINKIKYDEKINNEDKSLESIPLLLKNHLDNCFSFLHNDINNKFFDKYDINELRDLIQKISSIEFIKIPQFRNEYISDAEKELDELIGLTNVKLTIDKLKKYIKNSKNEKLNLHMAFYGNPGTGKTIVARLLANILYDIGAIKKNKIVEVSRKDLISQYVGETPIKTQNAIDEAMGGVLFIDEAYSLINSDGFDYGHECISTLIKAMEDKKGEFCVIFAGYKTELEEMINSNPGLKSRIKFHFNFDNYSKEELNRILIKMINDSNYSIDENARKKVLDIFENRKKDPNFANAREVRNIIEDLVLNLKYRDEKSKVIKEIDVDTYIAENNIKCEYNFDNSKILTSEEQLDSLIGLANVKKIIKKIKAYAKKNSTSNDFNIHMCFTGNPGTGKTEVARIVSGIFNEIGILKEAKLIETNANGLIGKYVGETGPKTEKIINKSMNGVLFIDEAYALGSNNKNSYGDEAISTLIKRMEDNRGEFCCILAGYKNEMDNLISQNPGFDSRIQFYIDFPDYTRDELKLIALKMLKKMSYIIEYDALKLMLDVVDYYRNDDSFANARTLRNVINQVILNQNLRTENASSNIIIIDDIKDYIADEDIEMSDISSNFSLKYLYNDYTNFDTSIIDNNYIDESIISISGNSSQGTGFIISKDGICLTCAHCLNEDDKQKARVIFNMGRKKVKFYYDFNILFVDKKNDFAIIKLNEDENEFSYLPLESNNYDYNPLTEFIVAGYPFGGESYENISITDGKIASENIYNGRDVVFANMFGKPGSSGSPIIDKLTMKVIGIFFGGIGKDNEMIHCFTKVKTIIETLQ